MHFPILSHWQNSCYRAICCESLYPPLQSHLCNPLPPAHKDFVADRKATVPLVDLQHSCTNHLASFTLIIHVLFTRLRHHQTCTYMRTTNRYSVFKYKFASFHFYVSCFRVSRNDALQYWVLTARYMAVNITIEFQAIHAWNCAQRVVVWECVQSNS